MEQASLPLISVIVPVYNIEKYLPLCINSIMEQTYKNLEVLLIDDGSTDCSGELCEKYCIQDRRFKTIHQENQGTAGARNTGLREATGDYISFIDGDDYIHPKFYEVLYNAINDGKHSFSMVGFKKTCEETEMGGVQTPCKTRILSRDKLMEELFSLRVFDDIAMIVVWNKLYKRETINKIEFLNFVRSEDHEYNTRVFLNTSSAVIVENAELYYYVQRPTSVVHQPINDSYIHRINTFLICLDDIPKDLQKYRGQCLERLYKTILVTRYNTPSYLHADLSLIIKHAKKSTMEEFARSQHISFFTKTSILFFYYFPFAVSFYLWLIRKHFLYKWYVKIVNKI